MSINKRSVCGIQSGKAGCEIFGHWSLDWGLLVSWNQELNLQKQSGPARFNSADFFGWWVKHMLFLSEGHWARRFLERCLHLKHRKLMS